MRTNMSTNSKQIKQEIWMLSRYIGAVSARWITVILLIPALFYLNSTILYIICMVLLIPLLIRAFTTNRTPNQEENGVFTHVWQKYHFTLSKYQAEKRANPFTLLLLILWQYRMASSNLVVFWQLYPGLLIIINILCRILITILFRIYLHHRFFHLDLLDD